MIGIGSSLLFGRRSGNPGPPIPSFNPAMVDAWFMSGLSNENKPDSIKGYKGNVLQLKNFAYALNSGFGKYAVNWNDFTINVGNDFIVKSPCEIKVLSGNTQNLWKWISNPKTGDRIIVPSYKILVNGLNDETFIYKYKTNDSNNWTEIKIHEGINDIPAVDVTFTTDISGNFTLLQYTLNNIDNITITQLPTAYEGALVFDGVDDYGICYNLPILTDYTVICRRVIEENSSTNVVASKSVAVGSGAFIFEYSKDSTYSFSKYNWIQTVEQKDSVSWQTKISYNGILIEAGDTNTDTDTLTLGIIREKDSRCLKGAIYYFALYDKSLTTEEIEEEKVKLESEWEGGKNELA